MSVLDADRPRGGYLLAVGLLLAGIVFASANGAIMKGLSIGMPVMMLIWGRYFAYLAIMLPIAVHRHGLATFRPPRPALQVLRAVVLVVATILFVLALVRLPFADAVAIFYVYPFLMTALSPLMLNERADKLTWIGVAGGFAGVLVTMRPGLGGDLAAGALALLAGTLTALFLLLTRMLARGGDAVILSTYTAMVCAAGLTLVLPFSWSPPSMWELAAFGLLGMATSLSHWLTAVAYGKAPATVLAPFTYAEIAVAVVFGLLFFGDWPDALGWLGMLLIVLSGVFTANAPRVGLILEKWRDGGSG